MSAFTHIVPTRANSVLDQMNRAAEAFYVQPELFMPEFWENVIMRATNIKTAQMVLDELDAYCAKGLTMSKFLSYNIVHSMKVARTTLRNHEMLKVSAS